MYSGNSMVLKSSVAPGQKKTQETYILSVKRHGNISEKASSTQQSLLRIWVGNPGPEGMRVILSTRMEFERITSFKLDGSKS